MSRSSRMSRAREVVETRLRSVQRRRLDQQELEQSARQLLDGAFGHGYLVRAGDGGSAPAQVREWPQRSIAGHTYHLHPRTRIAVAGRRLVLLGDPVDIDRAEADPQRIARRLWSVLRTRGPAALVREAAYLGGRWTLLAHEESGDRHRLLVLTDALASQPVYYSVSGGIAVGSHAVLVADALGHPVDDGALEIHRHARAVDGTGALGLPGLMTTHRDVLPLGPNCQLEVRSGVGATPAAATQQRYWPFEPRRETLLEEVYPLFRERLIEHVRLLSALGRPGISLTGGLDSRVTLAAYLHHRRPADFTFTYFNPGSVRSGLASAQDLFRASRLAQQCGIEHRLLRWTVPPDDHVFTQLHDATFPILPRSVGGAFAQWQNLPPELVQLQSNGPEVATTHSKPRTDDPITPQRMAMLWMGAAFGTRPYFTAPFEEWLETTDFTQDGLSGYDYHDLFYWEQRMGRWGRTKFQDGDFSHRILLPFNDRRLLELMLALPAPDRAAKVLFHRFLGEHPDLRLPDDPWEAIPDARD